MSETKLVKMLRDEINYREKTISNLRKENHRLKRIVKTLMDSWELVIPDDIDLTVPDEGVRMEFWGDREKRYSRLRAELLRFIVGLVKKGGEAVHHAEITKRFIVLHPKWDYDTVDRRIRELKAGGYLKTTKAGWYLPTERAVKVKRGVAG